jgi:hypothetical protein
MAESLTDRALPSGPTGVRIAGRRFVPGADRGVAAMLTAATSWVLQRLPGQVVERPTERLVRVRDGQRVLVEILAEGRQGRPVARVTGSGRRNTGQPAVDALLRA